MLLRKGMLNHALQRLLYVAIDDDAVLGCVHMETVDGQLVLTATDLTTWVSVMMPSDGDFHACLPLAALLEFVEPTACDDQAAPVEFMSVEDGLIVVALEAAMVTLQGLPVGDFPEIAEVYSDSSSARAESKDEDARLAAA